MKLNIKKAVIFQSSFNWKSRFAKLQNPFSKHYDVSLNQNVITNNSCVKDIMLLILINFLKPQNSKCNPLYKAGNQLRVF